VFLAQYLMPRYEDLLLTNFALHYPGSPYFRIWQPITYMFMHGGFSHLFFNMFALWMFGRQLEWDLGPKRFLTYYMITGVGAAAVSIAVNYMTINFSSDPMMIASAAQSITIGASGAVFGILLAFGMLHPNERLLLLIPPIPIKAKWFVILYGALELVGGIRGTDNIAHFAHLGGMIFGVFLILYWRKTRKI
ncbi:MAG: rhomboid family intramembrane serine protease, partial [Mucinivorans sp.]